MGRAAQVYDVTLAAGASDVILAEGSYYRILSATGALEIKRDDGSRVGPLQVGQGERNSPFRRLTVRDLSGAANAATILVCDGDFVDHRIAGVAEIADASYRTTLQGIAFMGGVASAIGAGLLSHVQLWNPAGSGKLVIVESVQVSLDSGSFQWRYHNAALSTLAAAPSNKLIGGAAAIAEVRSEANAAAIGTSFLNHSGGAFAGPINYLKRPFVLRAGYGLIVSHNAVNINTRAAFEWLEVNP